MEEKELLIEWMDKGMISIPQVLLTHYKELRLTETELVLLLQIFSFKQKGQHFPTFEELSAHMTITASECSILIKKLIQQQMLIIEEGDALGFESYSLKPLWKKLADFMIQESRQSALHQTLSEEKDLYTCFEQEFGRPLSPLECETLSIWIDQDHHDAVIIKAALREAVISGKLNFRYIDRILFEWKKKGIETLDQAREYGQRFRKGQTTPEQVRRSDKAVPFYNWLEQ
ncbi:DnaD domain-containing protein [Bacillus thermotolerans]|uniref:Chromosome replication initiation protein DnaD n=1 Tax=Bacillus thermotolerans TaxID=1221996 RepID=A0A0F5HZ44_BACTR|nr:DnaD domain-containing protein [Bacillus thermotolerans]KKB37673.1 Chromosome replication initiation protein DnaD [Bacillus thermotolerans]KKB38380.1 Chromosome replication initiation protein DnaD [Bacillus thermotolerans]KKB38488.1 Chromosome replication initiation protein DnaD [Bacillus thermotolerans]